MSRRTTLVTLSAIGALTLVAVARLRPLVATGALFVVGIATCVLVVDLWGSKDERK
jgi:hypothetical protein